METNVFKSIIGYGEVKLELMRILDQLKSPEKYAALGVTESHGLLLHGVPGVGKSTFASDFLNASGRTSFICRKDKSNGDFVDEIVRIFDLAEKSAPSVILLDDLDKFSSSDRRRRDTDEFVTVQTCIDRVKDKPVFVVATANDICKLPDSLKRPGRFDHILELGCPTGQDAEDIVAHYLSRKSFVADMDTKSIGRLLSGRSCAELEGVINQAGIYAAFDGRDRVEMRDMIKSILRIVFEAPESFNDDPRALPMVACHEAGHALVAELLNPESVNLITVLKHRSKLSGTTAISHNEDYYYSKKQMEGRVMGLLAGKAATEICFGVVDTGASNDLRKAFIIAERFVDDFCACGFEQYVYAEEVSDGLLERRDSRVAAEMARYYTETRQLLMNHKDKLEALTAKLMEEKTLLGSQIQEILKCA